MKIHFVPLHPKWLVAMMRVFAQSMPRLHQLTDNPDEADIILFLGNQEHDGKGVIDHPLPRQYPEKCFIYWDTDGVVPLLPGIYTNARLPTFFDLHRTESQTFIEILNPHVRPQPNTPKRYLFSFLGGSTSILRKRMFKVDWKRDDILVRNTSDYYHWDQSQVGRDEHQKTYADTLAASYFGLCMRGASAGGLRLFEVMQMGIAPVLLSDKLKLPEGPDWASFLLRIPERKMRRLPEILRHHQTEAAERGRLAQLAWERWFAPETVFNNLIDAYVRIRERRRIPERWIQPFWPLILWRHRILFNTRAAFKSLILTTFKWLRIPFFWDLNVR